MKRPTSIILSSLLAIAFVFGLSSCKKCKVDEDTNSGVVINDVIIYPSAGYMYETLNGNYHITGSSEVADKFEVSFDGGYTRVAVDWSQYDILCNPMTVNCKASFVRDVTYDNVLSYVFYTVTATTCESCDNPRTVENYVLIPKVPSGYQVFFDTEIVNN